MPTLRGLGTATPASGWDQADALAFARARGAGSDGRRRALEALYRRAGVEHRGIATPDSFYPTDDAPTTGARMARYLELARPLAREACGRALEDAGAAADTVTHLVTVSCTGFEAPGPDLALVADLGLRADVTRAHVGFMGCHGLLNGLAVARGFAATPGARVLLCAVEVCSLHFLYGLPDEEAVSHALFADGSAALVIDHEDAAGDAARGEHDWRLADTASVLLPDSADAMGWRVGDHGFEMHLSARVPDLVGASVRPWLLRWLETHDLDLGAVGSWAVHPGGPRVLDAVHRALELPAGATDVSRRVLAAHGNMSSATVGFLLARLRASGAPAPCVALAFGPGLVAEAALFIPG